ncbi:hypothetical protein QFZ67_002334 [Streptomyces sp. V1I1]|nr:hypothetical protein [Streptomyces sp. V1I1]
MGVHVLIGEGGFVPNEPGKGRPDAYPWRLALAAAESADAIPRDVAIDPDAPDLWEAFHRADLRSGLLLLDLLSLTSSPKPPVSPLAARSAIARLLRHGPGTPGKTAGDFGTGGCVSVTFQVSDESWNPDSRTTVGLPLPLQCR